MVSFCNANQLLQNDWGVIIQWLGESLCNTTGCCKLTGELIFRGLHLKRDTCIPLHAETDPAKSHAPIRILYPHSTRRRSIWWSARSSWITLVLGGLGVPAIRLRQIRAQITPWQRFVRPGGDLLTADHQSTTFCKAATEPDQITLCWRSDATRKRYVGALMAMLEIYGVQFPVWLRCRRPLLIRLRCSRSDYDQISACWLQSYECRRRSDAIADVQRPKNSKIGFEITTKNLNIDFLVSISFFHNMVRCKRKTQ